MNPAQRPMPDRGPLVGGRLLLADSEGARLSVALEGGGEVVARRAASCLLAPVPGDRVLVTLTPEPFVLAVLERSSGAAAELSLDGDARLSVRGSLTLEADRGIDLASRERVSVVARLFDVTAGEGRLTLKRLTAVARAAAGSFDTLGVLAKACDVVAERMSQKLGRSYRVVEETEQLRARHIDHRAEQTAQLKGETTVVVAEQVARIDGAQVTIG
jgi:hypothetical protein